MQIKTAEVKSRVGAEKTRVVGVVEYPVFESLDEAREHLGEEVCVKLITTQNATNLKNALRAAKTGTPKKSQLRNEAMARIAPERWAEVAGDPVAIENLVAEEMARVEEEYRQKAIASMPESGDEDGEFDEDED